MTITEQAFVEHASRGPDTDRVTWDATVTSVYQEHRGGFAAAAARIVGYDHGADVVQEMFIRVWANPASFDEARSNLVHYMYMVTRGISIDHLRSVTAREARDLRDTHRQRPADDDAATRVTDTETREAISRALANLCDNERIAISAAYFGHLTYHDVAARLGLPVGTVKSRIRSGLSHLRVELNRVEGRLEPEPGVRTDLAGMTRTASRQSAAPSPHTGYCPSGEDHLTCALLWT